VEHLKQLRSCNWSRVDVQSDMTPAYHCDHPRAIEIMWQEGCVEAYCLNPAVVPCHDYEAATRETEG
jgi:hypothetical protein